MHRSESRFWWVCDATLAPFVPPTSLYLTVAADDAVSYICYSVKESKAASAWRKHCGVRVRSTVRVVHLRLLPLWWVQNQGNHNQIIIIDYVLYLIFCVNSLFTRFMLLPLIFTLEATLTGRESKSAWVGRIGNLPAQNGGITSTYSSATAATLWDVSSRKCTAPIVKRSLLRFYYLSPQNRQRSGKRHIEPIVSIHWH